MPRPERIDVLRVLEDAAHGLASPVAIFEARAVVRELIEAADEVSRTGQGMFRLRAALAGAKGAA